MKAKWFLPTLLAICFLGGCSGGDEAPKDGDNPAASNAVKAEESPNAARRGPISGKIGSRPGGGAAPANMKGQ